MRKVPVLLLALGLVLALAGCVPSAITEADIAGTLQSMPIASTPTPENSAAQLRELVGTAITADYATNFAETNRHRFTGLTSTGDTARAALEALLAVEELYTASDSTSTITGQRLNVRSGAPAEARTPQTQLSVEFVKTDGRWFIDDVTVVSLGQPKP